MHRIIDSRIAYITIATTAIVVVAVGWIHHIIIT